MNTPEQMAAADAIAKKLRRAYDNYSGQSLKDLLEEAATCIDDLCVAVDALDELACGSGGSSREVSLP